MVLKHEKGSKQYTLNILELKNIDKSQSYPILADFGIRNFHHGQAQFFRNWALFMV